MNIVRYRQIILVFGIARAKVLSIHTVISTVPTLAGTAIFLAAETHADRKQGHGEDQAHQEHISRVPHCRSHLDDGRQKKKKWHAFPDDMF